MTLHRETSARRESQDVHQRRAEIHICPGRAETLQYLMCWTPCTKSQGPWRASAYVDFFGTGTVAHGSATYQWVLLNRMLNSAEVLRLCCGCGKKGGDACGCHWAAGLGSHPPWRPRGGRPLRCATCAPIFDCSFLTVLLLIFDKTPFACIWACSQMYSSVYAPPRDPDLTGPTAERPACKEMDQAPFTVLVCNGGHVVILSSRKKQQNVLRLCCSKICRHPSGGVGRFGAFHLPALGGADLRAQPARRRTGSHP